MSTPTQDIETGRAAEELQNNATFKLVLARMEERYNAEWKASQALVEREALHAKTRAIEDFKHELRILVDAGTRAKIEQEQKKLVDR